LEATLVWPFFQVRVKMKNTTGSDNPKPTFQEGRKSHFSLTRRLPYLLDPISRIGEHPIKILKSYLQPGNRVADLGCGWGHYAFVLADLVGTNGKVIAVDLDDVCIRSIQKKVNKRGIQNIEARAASAARLDFIDNQSIDLVFANGLLCSMASDRHLAVNEIKRILKPTGIAYICVGSPSQLSYLGEAEWVEILRGFNMVDCAPNNRIWSVVRVKPEPL